MKKNLCTLQRLVRVYDVGAFDEGSLRHAKPQATEAERRLRRGFEDDVDAQGSADAGADAVSFVESGDDAISTEACHEFLEASVIVVIAKRRDGD